MDVEKRCWKCAGRWRMTMPWGMPSRAISVFSNSFRSRSLSASAGSWCSDWSMSADEVYSTVAKP
eukprot:365424-Chlamydomonas_euryale.AAC.1